MVNNMKWIILWLIFSIGAAAVAHNRGANSFLWFIFGIFLGPIAFVSAFLTYGRKCPYYEFCRTGDMTGLVKKNSEPSITIEIKKEDK